MLGIAGRSTITACQNGLVKRSNLRIQSHELDLLPSIRITGHKPRPWRSRRKRATSVDRCLPHGGLFRAVACAKREPLHTESEPYRKDVRAKCSSRGLYLPTSTTCRAYHSLTTVAVQYRFVSMRQHLLRIQERETFCWPTEQHQMSTARYRCSFRF